MQDRCPCTCCSSWTVRSSHCQNLASVSHFYRYYFGRSSSELGKKVPISYFRGCYPDKWDNFSVTFPRCYKDCYIFYSFFLVYVDSGIVCMQSNDWCIKARLIRHLSFCFWVLFNYLSCLLFSIFFQLHALLWSV